MILLSLFCKAYLFVCVVCLSFLTLYSKFKSSLIYSIPVTLLALTKGYQRESGDVDGCYRGNRCCRHDGYSGAIRSWCSWGKHYFVIFIDGRIRFVNSMICSVRYLFILPKQNLGFGMAAGNSDILMSPHLSFHHYLHLWLPLNHWTLFHLTYGFSLHNTILHLLDLFDIGFPKAKNGLCHCAIFFGEHCILYF